LYEPSEVHAIVKLKGIKRLFSYTKNLILVRLLVLTVDCLKNILKLDRASGHVIIEKSEVRRLLSVKSDLNISFNLDHGLTARHMPEIGLIE